jgi:nitrate reductase gamma subunit
MNLLNNFLFIALPYVAIAVFLIGSIYRYKRNGYTYSALSSQFLEGRGAHLPLLLFHWGILALFVQHALAFLLPSAVVAWNSDPVRLLIHETLAFAFGLCVFIGLIGLLARRIRYPRLGVVTSRMDAVIELLLVAQFFLGLWIALGYRWGSSWFAADLSPYLWSILKLDPGIGAVSALPAVIKLHVAGAFVILGMVPFSRLAHFLVAPFHYTWRGYQQVIWYWDRKRVRAAATAWTTTPPGNN